MLFTKVAINADYNQRDPRSKKMPIYTVFEDFAESANKEAPEGMKNMRQASKGWNYMPSEYMLV